MTVMTVMTVRDRPMHGHFDRLIMRGLAVRFQASKNERRRVNID